MPYGMVFALAVMATIMAVPIVAILTSHMRAVLELKLQHRMQGGSASEAVEALRREMAELRDTSTRFDVSFDTALQRMEERMSTLEQRVSRADKATPEAVNINRQA
ncbi:MAG: hypothetical protein NT029_15455 [Armatimonadetes bacterium]|nr:hypothetical protein [Armatimonadota bacterium]